MATAILNMKKATKTAKVKNESLLRTKTIQRAATLLKQVSDPTRLQVVTLLSERERHVGGLCEELTMTPACHEPPPGSVAARGNRRPPPPGQEQLLQPHRHRLSAFRDRERRGSLTCCQDKNQPPGESEEGRRVVHFLQEIRSGEAHFPATTKVRSSTPLPANVEKFARLVISFLLSFVILQ